MTCCPASITHTQKVIPCKILLVNFYVKIGSFRELGPIQTSLGPYFRTAYCPPQAGGWGAVGKRAFLTVCSLPPNYLFLIGGSSLLYYCSLCWKKTTGRCRWIVCWLVNTLPTVYIFHNVHGRGMCNVLHVAWLGRGERHLLCAYKIHSCLL